MLAAMLEGCSARRPTVGRRRLRRGHFSISSTPKMSMAESSFVDGSITAQRLKQIHQSRRHQSSLEQLGTTSRKKQTNETNDETAATALGPTYASIGGRRRSGVAPAPASTPAARPRSRRTVAASSFPFVPPPPPPLLLPLLLSQNPVEPSKTKSSKRKLGKSPKHGWIPWNKRTGRPFRPMETVE